MNTKQFGSLLLFLLGICVTSDASHAAIVEKAASLTKDEAHHLGLILRQKIKSAPNEATVLPAVTKMIAAGANVNAQDDEGDTPLMAAARHNFSKVAGALVSAYANPNMQNNDGITALMHAALFGHKEVALILLRNGADPNMRSTSSQSTALMFAAHANNMPMVSLLLDQGANPYRTDHEGKTVFDLALDKPELRKILDDRIARLRKEQQEQIASLLKHDIDTRK